MIGFMVAGSILFLFLFLLCCPVSVEAAFQEQFSAQVGFLFWHYRVWPQPEKEQEQPTEQETQEESKPSEQKMFSKIKKLFRQKGFAGFMELLRAFCEVVSSCSQKIFSHTQISRLQLHLTVGGEDAAQTAIQYGKACALVSTALTVLLSAKKCKNRDVRVVPDFQNGKSNVRFLFKMKIRLFFLLTAVFSALIGFIRIYFKLNEKEKAVLKDG
ncbi:MAG: DUF2953 domain-containing protein [Oscillospiraceae bacterium]|jgi:hypothetical protein